MGKRTLTVLVALIMGGASIMLGYFTQRESFYELLFLFTLLFTGYAMALRYGANVVMPLVWTGIGLRVLQLLYFPNLSDDIYRFFWDGLLSINGYNPFMRTPANIMDFPVETMAPELKTHLDQLYPHLNSPEYYTIYPPVCQYIFALVAMLGPTTGATVLMKVFILAAEVGSILMIRKLLRHFELPERNLLLYALNPLVIVELTGNLHFEGIMIFFLLWAFWLLVKGKWCFSAIVFGLAVATKLLPLMFLPLLIRRIGWGKSIGYGAVSGGVVLALFAPYLSMDLIKNLWTSIDLYFQKFEFNASVYYLVRWVGWKVQGYNIIQVAGPVLSCFTVLGILLLSFLHKGRDLKSLPLVMLLSLTLYLSLSTIVHPWYITTLVALACFTNMRYAVIWSGLALFSYAAYMSDSYTENLLLVALEYAVVFAVLGYELWKLRSIASA